MSKVFQVCAFLFVLLFVMATPAMAAGSMIEFSPSAGAGIIMIGAAFGIARIGAAACESMARQPEAAGDIRGGMLLTAAFIEGATFFALVVCLIAALNAAPPAAG